MATTQTPLSTMREASAKRAGGLAVYALDLRGRRKSDGEHFALQVPAPDFALAVIRGLSPLAPHAHLLKLKDGFPLITLPVLTRVCPRRERDRPRRRRKA